MNFSEKTTLQIKQAIARVLPAGNAFRVLAEPTMIGKTHVLRVVTPAWSRKSRFDRIFKLQQAILPVLSASSLSDLKMPLLLEKSDFVRAAACFPVTGIGRRGGTRNRRQARFPGVISGGARPEGPPFYALRGSLPPMPRMCRRRML